MLYTYVYEYIYIYIYSTYSVHLSICIHKDTEGSPDDGDPPLSPGADALRVVHLPRVPVRHIHIHVCVCIYIYIYIHMYAYICIYTHTYIHVYVYVYVYIYIYIYNYIVHLPRIPVLYYTYQSSTSTILILQCYNDFILISK